MKAIKKNRKNLLEVAKSICEVDYSQGCFYVDFALPVSVCLCSIGRCSIGTSIINKIPSNYFWRVSFVDDSLKLYIWL